MAYCARDDRLKLTARGIKLVIPERDQQIHHRKNRGSAAGRPPRLDTEPNRRRNVVQRAFNVNKQWRGPATRYDKHAINKRAGVVLSAVITWLKALLGETRPRVGEIRRLSRPRLDLAGISGRL